MPHCVIPCQQRHRGAAPDPGGENNFPPPVSPCNFAARRALTAGRESIFEKAGKAERRKGRKSRQAPFGLQSLCRQAPCARLRLSDRCSRKAETSTCLKGFPDLKKSVAQLSGKRLFFEGRPSRLSGAASPATENRFSTLDEPSAATNILSAAPPKACLRCQRSGNENEKTVPARMRGRNSLPAQKTFRAPAQSARHALHRKRLRRSGMEIEN